MYYNENENNAPLPSYPPQQPRPPKKKGTPWFLKLVAGILVCAVVSAGSIFTFVALVNAGVVTISSSPSSETGDNKISLGWGSGQSSTEDTKEALTLQRIAAEVTPSVVCIQNYLISRDGSAQLASEGSGVIMDKNGYIITNAHVVNGADELEVVLYDGTVEKAKLIGSDTATDLALIKIKAENLTPAVFGDADELVVGDRMIAIGNPGGLVFNSSVTFGHVSALNRPIETFNGYTVNCIQTDAAINPGNSGGALVNNRGEVIGINSSKIVATEYEGLGFAISINEALPIIEDLREYGYVKQRPLVGITYQFIDETYSAYYGIPVGAYVTDVTTENAKDSGLRRGDVITALDGVACSSNSVLAKVLSDKKPGDTLTLTVYRDSIDNNLELELILSEYTLD